MDENLPKSIAEYLTIRGFKTLCVTDNFLKSARDSAIAEYASKEGMLILTLDSDLLSCITMCSEAKLLFYL
jgi:predicted nuclease of predicted toxin-antitoxin system